MKPRFNKLPVTRAALVVGSLLIGLALAPVAAQQASLNDGQVTIRSDGAVYLIQNGQRRWVATVNITDEDLNAYPEAEPIYVGLAPFGSSFAAKPGTSSSSSGSTATSKTGTPTSKTGSSGSSSSSEDSKPDPDAKTEPTNKTTCPASHMVKGGFDGKYYDINKRTYAEVEVKECFISGGDARKFGYIEFK
jgi:hypothetical protein